MKSKAADLQDQVTEIDERVDEIVVELTKIGITIEEIKGQGVDFKISVRNGKEGAPVWISDLVKALYIQTRVLRRYSFEEQQEALASAFEFSRFLSIVFRHKILFIIGALGTAVLLQALFNILNNLDLIRLF